jgi:predicted AAA+ superfamily ATPase
MELDMTATPETVWALLQEVGRKNEEIALLLKENAAEADQRMREADQRMKETDRQLKETGRKIDKLSKQMGGLHQSLGALIETLMASRLWEKFPQYNFSRSFQRIKIFDKNKKPVTEIDILLSDEEWAMAVEVKREPRTDDVDRHRRRMELMREYSLNEIRGKKLLGAIAGGVVSLEVREYAQKSGFYVLELNGDQVSLLESPEGFLALQG